VLAFVEGDSSFGAPRSRLTWVARDGHREDLPFAAFHDVRGLSLSPDGTRAAVSRIDQGQMQVHVYDLARGTGEAVTRDGQSWSPTWHPDGRSLAVTSQLHGSFDVRRVSADALSAPGTVVATDADEGDWRWAPDGASGVFRVWSPGSGTDLWRAKGDGSDPAPLVASALEEDHPVFSSDGRWLAHRSGASLYVAPYPSLAPRVLIAQSADSPRWSRATRELFYVESGRLKALPCEVREGAFRAASAAHSLRHRAARHHVRALADGRRFLFLARSPGPPDRDVIRVVMNGFEELRGRAPAQGRTP
jgi:dipeptidyl aminopeptidase/acylaminoacyl peptidase